MATEFNIQNYDMDLYTLSPRFFFSRKVERYTSFIWTERNYAAGDFQVVMPPTPLWMNALKPGVFVMMRGRRDVMVVENQSFENGLMTVTGVGLLKFLNQRLSWFKNWDWEPPGPDGNSDNPDLYADYDRTDLKPGEFISDVINKLCIHPVPFDGQYNRASLDWIHDKIPNLSLGYVTHKGYRKPLVFPNGVPIYDALEELAKREHVGIQLYLERANQKTGNYVLRFRTHYGKDRTSSQTDRETVRFSPKLESLLDPKELRSNAEYKNVCYVNYKGTITVHYAPHVRPAPVGFNRRVAYVDLSDKNIKAAKRPAARRHAAEREFKKHLHTHQVDGTVIANLSDYQYGFDYQLGDIVEVEGHSGMIVKARVTEYIRSQDQYGPKVYPTLEVIAEDETAYISDPTFEPDLLDPVYPETPSIAAVQFGAPQIETLEADTPGFNFEQGEDDLDFNPYTDPIFEGDDEEVVPDPQEDVGDVLDPTTETVPTTAQGVSSPLPWRASGWNYDYIDGWGEGFYVHEGNVYVIGLVYADSSESTFSGSNTLLTGIPPQYAPEAPVAAKVLIDHTQSTLDYAFDSTLGIGPWLDVTINPNGTVTFDDGNPLQSLGNPDYDWSAISIHLSTLTWPLSSQIYDAYDTDHSLDDFVYTVAKGTEEFGVDSSFTTDPWQNIDGTYSAHDERVHLNGKILKSSNEKTNAALLGIPFEFQAAIDTTVITPDGYFFSIASPDFSHHRALYAIGAQDPQAVGNNGCGFNAQYFYLRRSDGSLTRGSNTDLALNPAASDSGVEYSGVKGSPVKDLPDVASWIGNSYHASLKFKLSELISMPIPDTLPPWGFKPTDKSQLPDYSVVKGNNQLSFICGIAEGMASYYKVVFTYDSANNKVRSHLLLEQAGGTGRVWLAHQEWTPFEDPDGLFGIGFTLDIIDYNLEPDLSPLPERLAHPGYNWWEFSAGGSSGFHRSGSDYDGVPLVGTGLPSGPTTGDMGFRSPLSSKVEGVEINGIGKFPWYAEGDVIDFTNCGWPSTSTDALDLEEDSINED